MCGYLVEIASSKKFMEAPSLLKVSALVTCGILLACFVQSNYAEVRYIRSQRTYGGCIRWFLPREKDPDGTSITLGGYTTMFYLRDHIIEFDQPFISDTSEEVQIFLKNQAVIVQSEMSDGVSKTQSPSQQSTDGQGLSTTAVETTRGETSADSTSSTETTPQPSTTEETSPSTTVVEDIKCPANLTKGELICAGGCDDGTFNRCKGDNNCNCESICSGNTNVKILTCGCNSTDTRTFIPLGFTYFSGTSRCRCDANGTTVCDTRGECNGWGSESWTCQFENNEYQRISRLSRSRPSGCHELYENGVRDNGIYCVYPDYLSDSPEPRLKVYCDMGAWPQGGWTVIQRRVNGSMNFYRNWTDYRDGFGKLKHEFWLGNENIHRLTSQSDMQLRIDLQNDAGKYYALYSLFRIDNETTSYKLIALGDFTNGGGIEDSFNYHVNAPFSTYDKDSDLSASENCAMSNSGGWWFTNCHMCYLNGVYGELQTPGIRWYRLPDGQYNIRSTEMKIRPV